MTGIEGRATGESIMIAVVRAVSAYTDTAPTELPPLQHSVDIAALERLVASLDEGTVEFEHAGVALSVHGDGSVEVRGAPAEDSGAVA